MGSIPLQAHIFFKHFLSFLLLFCFPFLSLQFIIKLAIIVDIFIPSQRETINLD